MSKSYYFVCDEGVIWTVSEDGTTNYKGEHFKVNLAEKKAYRLSVDEGDTEAHVIEEEFCLWDSLTALAIAIEAKPNQNTLIVEDEDNVQWKAERKGYVSPVDRGYLVIPKEMTVADMVITPDYKTLMGEMYWLGKASIENGDTELTPVRHKHAQRIVSMIGCLPSSLLEPLHESFYKAHRTNIEVPERLKQSYAEFKAKYY